VLQVFDFDFFFFFFAMTLSMLPLTLKGQWLQRHECDMNGCVGSDLTAAKLLTKD
jgi:hypothetical protein